MGPPLRSFAPMRMTASWFGSLDPPNTRLWRDRSALECGLPSDRHLADPARLRSTVQPCSELSNAKPCGWIAKRRPALTAPARDGFWSETKKRAFISNKETDEGRKIGRSAETSC